MFESVHVVHYKNQTENIYTSCPKTSVGSMENSR